MLRDAAPKRREGPAQAAILRYLKRLPGVIVWRMNSRVVMLPGKGGKLRPVRFGGVKGMADILGSVPWCYATGTLRPMGNANCRVCGPRSFAFEVKSEGKPLSGDQEAFGAAVTAAGWLHARVESVHDVMEALGR